tara:strand:- start:23 stop:454 length:432 start_codon:yes stop_codon:yes gene_type:complete
MDPLTAGLFVAASFATSAIANRNQAKVEQASIKLQTSQAQLQASEAALERTKSFKTNIAMNLALSGMGFGSTTSFASTLAENTSNLTSDLTAINTGAQFAGLTGEANKALSKSKRFGNDATAALNAAKLAKDLGLFESKKGLK